ncbi:MAG: hypothetical protein ACR2PL_04115 [Dehalococcoidia bacterium]
MLRRLVAILPQEPPDWLIGFWAVYGMIFLLSLFVQSIPAGVKDAVFYWARLVVGVLCFAVAAGLGWRRSHLS